jgi:hypothetical protein
MSWNFVNSRVLQKGNLYGVWLTTTGVTSSDEIKRHLESRKWDRMSILPHGTLPTGQMVKEMRGMWMGADGTILPASDALLGYGPLFISDTVAADPGEVPSRAPGEKPPAAPEISAATREAARATAPSPWKIPAMIAVGLGLLAIINKESQDQLGPRPPGQGEDDEDDD